MLAEEQGAQGGGVVDQEVTFSDRALEAEVEGLRRDLLEALIPAMALLGWVWFSYSRIRGWPLAENMPPMLVLLAGAFAAHRLRGRFFEAACWALLGSLLWAEALIVAAHPFSTATTFGVLLVIAANGLLGAKRALGVTLVGWLVVWAAYGWGLGGLLPGDTRAGETLLLYALAYGATWLATRPLRLSVGWALTGWARARQSLTETRGRRAELYRALRALEEATYRIERMNHELVAARREAEVARALKARFVSTVSHELRGPLNLILGYSRLMALSPERYGAPLPGAYRRDMDTIYRNSQHLAALVDDVLDLSRIEAESLPLVKDRVDLEQDVVQKAISIVQPLAERKGLRLRQELARNLPWVLADAVRLRQVLLNLLNNAIRLTERGEIVLRTACQAPFLLVTVQDTGPGIAPEEMPNLFREFQQMPRGPSVESGGSGLGLAICKQLVELHGGQIWAESTPGVGTAFTFSVPLPGVAALAPGAVKTEESLACKPAYESCLIVHDDPGVVRALARHIEGYRVIGLPNVSEVPLLTRELHPRAIVTSPALVEPVQASLSGLPFDVPVVAVGLPQVREQSGLSGVLGYLIKPVAPETLTMLMRQVEQNGETTVLLVDDDPDMVRLMESFLLAIPRPYRILKAYDGAEALEKMAQVVPDVVFIDLLMPGLDGRQTIRQMRADERLRAVPVVIVSARDWTEEGLMLQAPFIVRCEGPLEIDRGARCLQVLLDTLRPRYLDQAATPQSS